MTTPAQQLRDRLITSANLPVVTAQTMLKMLNIIDKQQGEIDELRQMLLGHERRIADANKNISRLSGVHGA